MNLPEPPGWGMIFILIAVLLITIFAFLPYLPESQKMFIMGVLLG